MNCIIIDDDKLSCKILEGFVKKNSSLDLKGVFFNPIDAINETQTFKGIDVIFLDVEMPEMTGLDILSSISPLPNVVVISSSDKYAVDAFDFDVVDFLLKPIKYPRFVKSLQKLNNIAPEVTSTEENLCEDGLFLRKSNALYKVKYNEICFVESVENYIAFQTFDSKYIVHQTLKSVEKQLPSTFWRVHRSYVVNINNVKIIEDNTLLIATDNAIHKIPIGKVYKEKLLAGINPLK